MSCCSIEIPFYGIDSISIPWPGQYTKMPAVSVGVKNEDGYLTLQGVFVQVLLTDTSIDVNLGGVSDGVIRITL